MVNKNQRTKLVGILIAASFFAVCFLVTKFINPAKTQSAGLNNASATMSNSRLSFRAGVGATGTVGSNLITIGSTAAGAHADITTNHLFPGDYVCFSDGGIDLNEAGCKGNTSYKVNRINTTDTFSVSSGLLAQISGIQSIVATQSGTLTLSFLTGSTAAGAIPANGTILVTIPAVNTGNAHDGIPDEAASTATGGFDLNAIAANSAVSISGGSNCTWASTFNITAGTGASDHTVVFTTTTACAANTTTPISITIGNTGASGANLLVNPPAITTGHVVGSADYYTIGIKTRDDLNYEVESVDAKVAPIEGVLVSATVDQTLTFQVEGIGSGTAACNVASNVTTTPYSVPWGTVNGGLSYSAAQKLTLTTNAPYGYAVTIEENDQMGKDGNVCVGSTAGEGQNCIQDTTCAASACSQATAGNWINGASYPGLGFSLENLSGSSPAVWMYNQASYGNCGGSPTFCAKQIADIEALETKATIMTKTTPQTGNQIHVCYRLAVSGTQPAGYYYNKVKYTATAIF